jgi:hypothetical protein
MHRVVPSAVPSKTLDQTVRLWQQMRMSEPILKFVGTLKELAIYLLHSSSSAVPSAELPKL